MHTLNFPQNRDFDLACIGRLAVDLYSQQVGCKLEDVNSFAKYLGGSSANIASGTARLGLKSAMISKVGNEQMGNFLVQELQKEGCDTSQVKVDPERLTALVLLALKDRETFPLLFYRENCADMALSAEDIDPAFIARCKALLITGTHLSQPTVLGASLAALAAAKEHGTVRVLDIDYRPVLWGLTSRGDGETRFIANDEVTAHLQKQLPHFELIIGTEEEFLIAGGVPNSIVDSLKAVRKVSQAVLVLKRGPLGCTILEGDIPTNLDDAPTFKGQRVEVLNVLGAGDAFASGLLYGLITGKNYEESADIANICGAVVVSRLACSPAMPTPAELAHWRQHGGVAKPDQDATLSHLHRVSGARKVWNNVCVLAFDHRSQFYELARDVGASESRIPQLKNLMVKVLEQVEKELPHMAGQLGILADGTYGHEALCAATGRDTAWWIGRPVERPGTRPLMFDKTRSIASQLQSWPLEQVVKCLVFFHPEDDASLRLLQEEQLLALYEAVQHSGHELLLEVIPPAILPSRAKTRDHDEIVLRTIKRIYNLGIKPQWWKIGAMQAKSWDILAKLANDNDPFCRGAVILGLNQPENELIAGFKQATHPFVKGFMIGRSVWAEPSALWLANTIDDATLVSQVANNFMRLINGWQSRK